MKRTSFLGVARVNEEAGVTSFSNSGDQPWFCNAHNDLEFEKLVIFDSPLRRGGLGKSRSHPLKDI